jgi:site-specific DNA recombinase
MNSIHNLLEPATAFTLDELEERYHRVRSEIAKHAMTTRVEAGECPGRAPLGYRNVVVDGQRTVAVDPAIAPLIVDAFRMAAQRKSSLRKIIAALHPRGLIGRGGKPVGVSSLQAILTNPFYAGFIRYGEKLYHGTHQPLISRTLFDRVHRNLFRRRCH